MPDLIELYRERVAIMEVDANIPTPRAQWDAYIELRKQFGIENIPDEIKQIARDAIGQL